MTDNSLSQGASRDGRDFGPDTPRERLLVRLGVPLVLATVVLALDLLLHEVVGQAWHSVAHYLMAGLLLSTSFVVFTIYERNLSRRAAARAVLESREQSYRTLFDIFPGPTTVWSGEGILLLQNLVSARNMGGDRETYLGKTIIEMFGVEVGRGYLDRIQRVYRTGVSEEQEDEVLLPNLGRRVFMTAMQRVHQPDGSFAVQVISYDVTERVEAEEAWRAEHQRASMYLNIAAVMIVALDLDQKVTMINSRGCEILGCSEADIIGKDWFEEFVAERVRERVRRDFDRFLDGALVTHGAYENAIQTLRGEERLIAWQTVLVRDEAGKVVGTLSSGEDVTDQRRAEDALRSSEMLRVQERTALAERQRLARELHDSVSQALYGIALGINTALAMLDRNREATREALEYSIGLARAGLSEMRALIFELRPESLESEGLVAALAKQAEAVRARFELPVNLDACGEPDLSLEAKEALYRISAEALHNAVKHAHAKELSVRLMCDDSFISLSIRDDGVGFCVMERYPGHLGLKSMRERADGVGGTLRIESAPGKGTVVEVRAPIEKPSDREVDSLARDFDSEADPT